MKFVKITPVAYEMLQELAKRNRKQVEPYLEEVIKTIYQAKK